MLGTISILAIRCSSMLRVESKPYDDREVCWIQRDEGMSHEINYIYLPYKYGNGVWEIGLAIPYTAKNYSSVLYGIQQLSTKIEHQYGPETEFGIATQGKLEKMFGLIKDEAKKYFSAE